MIFFIVGFLGFLVFSMAGKSGKSSDTGSASVAEIPPLSSPADEGEAEKKTIVERVKEFFGAKNTADAK